MIDNILSRIINWRKVRTLGELRVITKASYIMLIAVPILAGVWLGVRIGLNSYNKSIEESILLLENATVKLKYQSEFVANKLNEISKDSISYGIVSQTNSTIDNLDSSLRNIICEFSNLTIEKRNLPHIWVFAFFAALTIFFAHLIYQSNAPELIKKDSYDEFTLKRKSDYASNPNNSAIDRAKFFVKNSKRNYEVNLEPPFGATSDEKRRWEIDIVETGASAEYLFFSNHKLYFALFSGILYYLGILILLYIVIHQTISVLEAAGWIYN